jgi:mannose-6-phosphate isomerase
LDALFIRLLAQYPGDVGCFSIYLLNFIELKKGESLFLRANIPHAYLLGDCVECMACSDNVVRAGLTPKFKDVRVLCEMLDYSMRSIDETKLKSTTSATNPTNVRDFRPSVDEFSVQEIRLDATSSCASLRLPKLDSASILIVIESNSSSSHFMAPNNTNELVKYEARPGLVYFIGANAEVELFLGVDKNASFLAYRAYVDIKS